MTERNAADLILTIRECYAKQLASEFVRLRSLHSGNIYTEAALRRSDGEIATDGDLHIGTRVDVVITSSGDFLTVNSESIPSFSPFRLHRKGIEFIVAPFQWDWCIVTLLCNSDDFSFQPILDWFHHWFDGDDMKVSDGQGLCGVVHFLGEPHLSGDKVSMTIDLGSSPPEAFYELLDACAELKPSSAFVSNAIVEKSNQP